MSSSARLSRALLVLAIGLAGCSPAIPAPGQPVNAAAGSAPALPASIETNFELAALYRWAAAHHDELKYMPCTCGCKGLGHTSNSSCFVKEMAADGAVVAWDGHAEYCWTCQQIARDTRDMLAQGKSLTEIRAHVDQTFAGVPMDTPHPTAGSAH